MFKQLNLKAIPDRKKVDTIDQIRITEERKKTNELGTVSTTFRPLNLPPNLTILALFKRNQSTTNSFFFFTIRKLVPQD